MAKFNWIRGRNGNWNDAANWQNGAVPDVSDTVYVASADEKDGNTGPTVTSPISVASIHASGNVDFETAGSCNVAGALIDSRYVRVSGTDLAVGGTLTVTDGEKDYDASYLQIFADGQGTASHVTAKAIDNESVLEMSGSTLDVQGPASFGTSGEVTGDVYLFADSLIEFSGTSQITTIASGANLSIGDGNSFVADKDIGLGDNSALTGLAFVYGRLELGSWGAGAEIDAAGSLRVEDHGFVSVQGDGGLLSVAKTLVNEGVMTFGTASLPSENLLDATGKIYNDGAMTLRADTEEVRGELLGQGTVAIGQNSTLTFDSEVGRQQQFYLFNDGGSGVTLSLDDPGDFNGSIHRFFRNDSFLFHAFDASTTFDFVANNAGTGGVLNVSDGANGSAHIHMSHAFNNDDFQITSVAGGGERIAYKF